MPEDNVGSKLKSLANTVQVVGIIVSIVVGLLFGILAFVIIPLGLFCTYVFSMLIHGVGHSAEMSEKCAAFLLQQEQDPQEEALPPQAQEPWVCVQCGTENWACVAYCQSCGISKAWSQVKQKEEETTE